MSRFGQPPLDGVGNGVDFGLNLGLAQEKPEGETVLYGGSVGNEHIRKRSFKGGGHWRYLFSANDFTIGQIYDDGPALTVGCRHCGETKLFVGKGSHYTAIKCPKCGWEECVHDG